MKARRALAHINLQSIYIPFWCSSVNTQIECNPLSDYYNLPIAKRELYIYTLSDLFFLVWTAYDEMLFSEMHVWASLLVITHKNSTKNQGPVLDWLSYLTKIIQLGGAYHGTGAYHRRGLPWACTRDWPAVMSTDLFNDLFLDTFLFDVVI